MNRKRKLFAGAVLALSCAVFVQSAGAFTDGSGYQILLTIQSSLSELKKQLKELKKVRSTLKSLQDLSIDDASTAALNELERHIPPPYLSAVSLPPELSAGEGLPTEQSGNVYVRAEAVAAQIEQSIVEMSLLEHTPRRQRLMRMAYERVRRIRQESLVANYSLSERQSRDLEIDLLLELVNHGRDAQARLWSAQERAGRYRDGLTDFLY